MLVQQSTNGNKTGGGEWELQPACLLAGSLVQENSKDTEAGLEIALFRN